LQNRTLWNKKHLNPKIRNLPDDEFEAIQNLVRLQKERQIVVKPADKGSGIVVVDYDDYVDSCIFSTTTIRTIAALLQTIIRKRS
ncbi:MAG: hypothetical protein GY786_16215, partial [Proteobacteria bacterium]|nr:hypothetical protein [Pseudomonadota bacterium]